MLRPPLFAPLPALRFVCVLTLASCTQEAHGPPFEVDVKVTEAVLDNGLEVLVIPNHTAPAVTALVAFRAGSSVEDETLNGYSHLFEHMIFQGSREVPDSQEFGNQLEALGATYNATTREDSVSYYFSAPSASLDPTLELFAGALKAPALDADRLDKERNVVLSEADLDESSPTFTAHRAGLRALFGDYAVRLDPLGSRDVVMNVTRADLASMHDTYYVPNNAMLVLSGDVTPDAGKMLAERHFADWERAPDPFAAPLPKPEPLRASQYRVLSADVTNTRIEVWWQGPNGTDDPEGVLAGSLLSSITYQTDHAFRSLVGSAGALSAQFGLHALRRAGYVRAVLTVPPGNERNVLGSLRTVLAQLGELADVTEVQLQTAQEESFNDYLHTVVTPDQLPQALGLEFGVHAPTQYFDYPDALYGVRRTALQRFAETYLRDQPRVIVLTSSEDNLAAQGIDEDWLASEDAP